LKSVFRVFDANSDGKVSPGEIRKAIDKLNYNLNDQEVNEMIDGLDKNDDGKIEFDGRL
jgi:Ca2+-binding EF-hand superfamily protein